MTFHEHEFPFAEDFTEDTAPLSPPVTVGFDDDIDDEQLIAQGGNVPRGMLWPYLLLFLAALLILQ